MCGALFSEALAVRNLERRLSRSAHAPPLSRACPPFPRPQGWLVRVGRSARAPQGYSTRVCQSNGVPPREGGLTWAWKRAAKCLTQGQQLQPPRQPRAATPSLSSPNGRYTPARPRATQRAPPRPHPFLPPCDQSGVGPRRRSALARCPGLGEWSAHSAHGPAPLFSPQPVSPLRGVLLAQAGSSLPGMWKWRTWRPGQIILESHSETCPALLPFSTPYQYSHLKLGISQVVTGGCDAGHCRVRVRAWAGLESVVILWAGFGMKG